RRAIGAYLVEVADLPELHAVHAQPNGCGAEALVHAQGLCEGIRTLRPAAAERLPQAPGGGKGAKRSAAYGRPANNSPEAQLVAGTRISRAGRLAESRRVRQHVETGGTEGMLRGDRHAS